MKRILSIFLVLLTLVNILGISTFASEITTAGGNNDVPVELTQSVTTFSVTVPTVLPVDLDANGVVTVATDNKIINNSWGPVEVKGVSLTPLNDWVLVDFETDFKNKKVGLKEFGFELNNSPVLTDGSCEATFDVIPGNSEINFSYDANVATQKQALEDQQIAYVIFTIGWATSNSDLNSFIPVTSIDSEGNNLNASSTEIVGDLKEELLISLDASGLANSNEVDFLINVESDNFEGMADTTFDLSNIANTGDTVVILHYDESTNEWEYISTETVDKDGLISADFSGYSPVVFIINGETVTLNMPGLYNIDGNMICSWENSGMDITCSNAYNVLVNSYPATTKIVIPKSVNSIEGGAFSYCTNLISIEIPNSVESISRNAFNNCYKLESITVDKNNANYCSENGVLFNKDKTEIVCYPDGKSETVYIIPNSVKIIGDLAFSHCKNLTSVKIPDSVTTIGWDAFFCCEGLMSIEIPNSVTKIDGSAFCGCTNLTSVKIPNSITVIDYQTFERCTNLTTIEIPDSVTTIGRWAFADCTNLTSIKIPNSVTTIGYNAFYRCENLTSIKLSNNIKIIESQAFAYCTNLTSIKIPNSVTTISNEAFYLCTGLTTIEIPNSITLIYEGAFANCSALTTVNYTGTQEQWEKINIRINNGYLTSATINYNYTD